ncbi:hypothetical protein ACFQ5J_03075 [Lacticaseibacillus baoqingensis]|uniref:DUF1878 family protein n=1 Tax=Lacticaseibacillus baoqingensis TaxID=2486013 RepID=A0ABW4E648_9LACO|nr:hypothetical protein [Lacticaseibacillus baoqingensis]
MLTEDYIQLVNQELDRLLVYETVFKEYTATCHKLEIGNCFASENFEQLHDYFSRNVLRFNHFVSECYHIQPPAGFTDFNETLLTSLEAIKHAVSLMLMAIEPTGVNHPLYEAGLHEQARAHSELDAAFALIGGEAQAM